MSNITVNMDNLSAEDREQLLSLVKKANAEKKISLRGVKNGETFTVGGIEFIKFPDVNGVTPVVAKNIVFESCFGNNNDLRKSDVLNKLQEEILPKILSDIGAENVCTFKTDLTTLDGLKPYGEMESMISLPTFDFYRANVEIFDKYKVDGWWWLATPESANPHDDPYWIVCVAPSGVVYRNSYRRDCGVRPILFFVSSIFDACEE